MCKVYFFSKQPIQKKRKKSKICFGSGHFFKKVNIQGENMVDSMILQAG